MSTLGRRQPPRPDDADDRKTTFAPPAPLEEDDRKTTFEAASPLEEDDRKTTYAATDAPSPIPLPRPAAPREPADRFQPGATVLGKYEIIKRARSGAQAMAFIGKAIVDRRDVFIKIQLNPTRDPHAFDKQLGLRKKILEVDHPNLMRAYDYGLEGDALCEVYEFVPGMDFTEWVDASRPLSDATIRSLIKQFAEGVNALQKTIGLAHRDLKPDNLLIVESDGRPLLRIVDYGTASHLDSGGVTTVAGTRDYSPPEFYTRLVENDDRLGSWDWWSVGRILQEVIDGVHPKKRLAKRYPDRATGRNAAQSDAVMAIFDAVMLEHDIDKYQMRAGMVELSQENPANARWIPLLQGLLTSNRAARWGYREVSDFLEGKTAPNGYYQQKELDGFRFEEAFWRLPDLAKKLANESRSDARRWEVARKLLYAGEIRRYVHDTLRNVDLERRLDDPLRRRRPTSARRRRTRRARPSWSTSRRG